LSLLALARALKIKSFWLCQPAPPIFQRAIEDHSLTSIHVVQLDPLTCASSEKEKWTCPFQGALLGNDENKVVKVSISTESVTIHEKD
jgi:hypothetical protein